MASGGKTKNKSGLSKTSLAVAAVVVVLGLPLVLFSTQQRTETQQHASQFNDLNTSYAITETNNADGTMGPVDSLGNISNTFPQVYLGTLNLLVTDPPQTPQYNGSTNPGNAHNPNSNTYGASPTHTIPTQATGYKQNETTPQPSAAYQQSPGSAAGGPQAVTSLKLTIKKAEVHLAHIGLPGSKNEEVTPSPQIHPTGPHLRTNQEVDKWETLKMDTPQTLDLVQLYTSHSLAPLCLTKLVNGKYTEIRLYVSSASATLQDGTNVSLVIPGRNNIVRIVHPFAIDSSKISTLTVDFDAQNSVIKAGDQYILKPVVAKMIDPNKPQNQ